MHLARKEVEQQGKLRGGSRGLRLQWSPRPTGQRAADGEDGGEGVDEGVYEAGEQKEAHRRGAPLAGTANPL